MGRYGKWLAVAALVLGSTFPTLSADSVYAIASDPSGSCNSAIYTSIYISIATGKAWVCSTTWTEFALGGGGNEDWVKKGIDVDADGVLPAINYYSAAPIGQLQFDSDGDLLYEFLLSHDNTGVGTTFFFLGDAAAGSQSYWTPSLFMGIGDLGIRANGDIRLIADVDSGNGSFEIDTNFLDVMNASYEFDLDGLKFWKYVTGSSRYGVFTWGSTSPTANRTYTLPDNSGGLVLLNGTTYPTGPLCAEWQTDGRLGIAATNAACGSGGGGSGDDIRVNTSTDVTNGGTSYVNFVSSARVTVTGNTASTPDTVTWDIASNSLGESYLGEDIVWGANDTSDFSPITYNAAGEGFVLPWAGECSTLGTFKQGSLCWDTTTTNSNTLWGSTGSSWVQVGGGTGDITSVLSCTGPGDCPTLSVQNSQYVRAGTAGFIGLHYTTTPDYGDGAACLSGMAAGDIEIDLFSNTNPEMYVCSTNSKLELIDDLVGGGGSYSSEDDGAPTATTTFDFLSGFDLSYDGSEANISFQVGELTLAERGIWMGGGLTGSGYPGCEGTVNTQNVPIVQNVPGCTGTNVKLAYVPAIDGVGCENDVEGHFDCESFSTSSISNKFDYDLNGTDPTLTALSDGSFTADFDGTHNTSPAWEMSFTNDSTYGPSVIARTLFLPEDPGDCPGAPCCLPGGTSKPECYMPLVNLGTPIRRFNEVRADHFYGAVNTFSMVNAAGDVVAAFGTDETGSKIKFYLNSNTTTPSFCVIDEAIDANCDGVGDTQVAATGISTTAPNYSQSFTNESTVTIEHFLGNSNLLTSCYDGSGQQITPTSTTIGATAPYDVTVTFSGSTTGRCVVNAGASGKYHVTFSDQIAVTVDDSDLGFDPYRAQVTCYDNATPRNRVEPDSIEIDDATGELTINFAVGQSGRCTVS